MISASVLQFTALLLIVGAVIRLIESYFPDSPLGKALAFIY
jgi:hypothetical protein